jgi:hypothetical protein
MAVESSRARRARDETNGETLRQAHAGVLRGIAIGFGVAWSLAFPVIGLAYGLQMFGDGAIFSYAVAVHDAWGIHWHNIPGRLTAYVLTLLPPELFVALSGNARGGIALYGLLHFSAQAIGLLATFFADRSRGRVIFACACASTAVFCPLVFGFPTETWMAHALFWPTLAICHYARDGIAGLALVFVLLLALVFTHEGALIFALAILAALALRGLRDAAFLRATAAFAAVVLFWIIAKTALPPDAYIAGVLATAAWHVFDPARLANPMMLTLLAALAGYAGALIVLRRVVPNAAVACSVALIAILLAVYWLGFDRSLHAENRYFMRTVLLIGTPALGLWAAVCALDGEGRLALPYPPLRALMRTLARREIQQGLAGALVLVMLLHAVEIAKFVRGWNDYTRAVRALATGPAADPVLGDDRFVSSQRIGAALSRLAWNSTTPFLSILLTPDFAPARLVIDPTENYFWLSCAAATAMESAARAIPRASRTLVRIHTCEHR